MKGKSIFIIGGVVLLMMYLGKAQAALKLRALFAGARLQGGKIEISVDLQNVTGSALHFNSIVGDIYANGTYVGNVSSFQSQVIAANSVTRITMMAAPSIGGALTYLKNALTTKLQCTVAFRGNINAEGLIIPVDQVSKLF